MVEKPRVAMRRRPALAEIGTVSLSGLPADALSMRLLPPQARLALRVEFKFLPEGGRVGEFSLDMAVNRRAGRTGRIAMRLGPNEWLLCAPEGEAAQVAAEIETALAGRHFSLVDVSHSRLGIALSGTCAPQLLNSGCPLDLSATAFGVGQATRTLIGRCEVILAKTDDQPTFEIECARSFSIYLRNFLLEAARGLKGDLVGR